MFVSESHHEQVPFPFATPYREPKHAASQATTLVVSPQEHTIHSLDKTSRKPSNNADKLQISLVPAKSAGAARNFAEPECLGNKSPKSRTILARSSITGEESLEEHGVLPRVDEKTTIEALQLPTTFGAAPPQVPDLRTVRGMDPSMSQSGFTYFDRTGTTFKPVLQKDPSI